MRTGRGSRTRRNRARRDARHRHRLGAVRRRPAGAQHRARPPAGGQRGGRAARLGARPASSAASSWQAWAAEVNVVLAELHRLLWPDLFIIGGGVTENWASFGPLLSSRAEIVVARFGNDAGLIGAAMAAVEETCPGPRAGASAVADAASNMQDCPQQAARRRHDHLHGDVAARRGARRDQPVAGLSGFLAAATPGRARRRRTCAPGSTSTPPCPGCRRCAKRSPHQVMDAARATRVAGDGDHDHRRAGRRRSSAPCRRSSIRGDEVILLDPAYDSYEPAVRLAGGVAVRVPLAASRLRRRLGPRPRRGRAARRG